MKIKILHVIDSGGLYGAEIMLLSLIQEQIRSGMYSEIASIGTKNIDEKPLEREAKRLGIKLKKIRMNPGIDLNGVRNLLTYAHNGSFDLIHSHGYKGNILLGFLPRCIRKIPIVATIHGYVSVKLINKMMFYELMDELSHRWINKVILVNKKMLEKFSFSQKTGVCYEVINNGICLNNNKDLINDELVNQDIINFCKNYFTIGSIGRLSTEKGFSYLINAFYILLSNRIDARLVILGDGPDRSKLESLVNDLGMSHKVLFAGYTKNAKIYIQYFNVYVISSLTEGLPITLLEAMYAKVPVVATRVGGIPEVMVHETDGLIVSPQNIEEIADAILRIYNNPDLAEKFTINSYHRVIQKFSSCRMAAEYNKLYNEILSHE